MKDRLVRWRFGLMALALGALVSLFVCTPCLVATPASLSNDGAYTVNKMNSISYKYQIGTLIQDALSPGGFAALADGKILVGDGSGTAQAVTPSGDLTMSDSGVFTLNGGNVREVTGTLTQANITGMNGTPVVLVATPAAATVIIPESLEWNHVYSTAAYTGGGKVEIGYNGGTDFIQMGISTVTGAATATYWIKPSVFNLDGSTGTGTGYDITSKAAAALTITNATGAFTAGNAANVVHYRLKYRLAPVP